MFTELTTVLVHIKEVHINSRPVTTVTDDVDDDTPIILAHLESGRSLTRLPDAREEIQVTDSIRELFGDICINKNW